MLRQSAYELAQLTLVLPELAPRWGGFVHPESSVHG
jgi:hypothetical protein